MKLTPLDSKPSLQPTEGKDRPSEVAIEILGLQKSFGGNSVLKGFGKHA